MATVTKRPLAESDLDEIWWYIVQDNPDAADRMLDRIDERYGAVAEFPLMGASREELFPALRSFTVGKYVVSYLPQDDGIEVVRVIPGMRDIEAFF
jgi:toxin ParE1/3/4